MESKDTGKKLEIIPDLKIYRSLIQADTGHRYLGRLLILLAGTDGEHHSQRNRQSGQ